MRKLVIALTLICFILTMPCIVSAEIVQSSIEEPILGHEELDKTTSLAEEDEIIDMALATLTEYWRDEVYGNSNGMDLDGYVEVKWTRVIYIKDSIPEKTSTVPFTNMNCFVEFFILSDYFGSHPYYSHTGSNECVAFLKDGSFEVLKMNPLETYRSQTYTNDLSSIIESISDRGSDFNQSYSLLQ